MKRLLIFILITTLFIHLFGCMVQPSTNTTQNHNNATEDNINTTTQTEQKCTEPIQKPMYAIAMPPVQEVAKTGNGETICEYTYQNISLTLPEPEIADNIILDYLNRMDAVTEEANSTLFLGRTEAEFRLEKKQFLIQLLYTTKRFDASILSLSGDLVRFSGGAHTNHSGQAVTYDLLTGKSLSLTDVLQENVTPEVICQLVTKKLAELPKEITLFTTYDQTLKQLFGSELKSWTFWYLSENGLCFGFDPYNIGPFSSGTIVAEIPYADLTGILKDAYFPAEEDTVNGEIEAELFNEEILQNFTQFSEIVLTKDTTKILLHTDGSVRRIRIEVINTSENLDREHSSTTIFTAYTLTPGDAIMVEADLQETVIRIYYDTGKAIKTMLLKLENGKPVLQEQ